MMKAISLVRFGVALAIFIVSVEGRSAERAQEQTHFSAEDEAVRHPARIYPEVLKILAEDGMVKLTLTDQKIDPENLPVQWFSASEIDLGLSGKTDLIVQAEGPLVGANVDTFWVFIREEGGYSLALTIPAHDLLVRKSRSNRYRDIEAVGATAVTLTTMYFCFDGKEYRFHSSKTENIK